MSALAIEQRPDKRAQARAEDIEQRATLSARIRQARLQSGQTQSAIARAASLHLFTYRAYEAGTQTPRPFRLQRIAHALGIPVAALLCDELILAEVRISDNTLQRVKTEGRPAAEEAGKRIAAYLTERLLQEAMRQPVDVGPGARPRKRRTRAEILAGIAEANKARARVKKEREVE